MVVSVLGIRKWDRLQGSDETEDGEDTSTGGGEGRSGAFEGSSSGGGLSGRASARRSRGNDGSSAVGRGVGSNGSSRRRGSRDGGGLVHGGLLRCDGSRGGAVGTDRDDGRGSGLDDSAT